YILVAEKDKLEMLVKDNPSLFFEILPYAYVLGVSDVYMKKFEDIKIEIPEYYRTDADGTVFARLAILHSSFSTMSTSFTTSIHDGVKGRISGGDYDFSSDSSGGDGGGSGGGGFSGGGSGGGGGGRW
ncbi:MAG: DUF2207 domain-containing protein, partial [Clostridia bacterium]|nr:DUF2207 domain-containing protein [Clostridia bacterium]